MPLSVNEWLPSWIVNFFSRSIQTPSRNFFIHSQTISYLPLWYSFDYLDSLSNSTQTYYNYAKRSVTIRAHNDISVYTVSSEKLVQAKSVALEGCLSTGFLVPIIWSYMYGWVNHSFNNDGSRPLIVLAIFLILCCYRNIQTFTLWFMTYWVPLSYISGRHEPSYCRLTVIVDIGSSSCHY